MLGAQPCVLCQVFQGNVDYGTMQTNMFDPPITAQFIRIYPVVCRRACTLRLELIGCEMNGKCPPGPVLVPVWPTGARPSHGAGSFWGTRAVNLTAQLGRTALSHCLHLPKLSHFSPWFLIVPYLSPDPADFPAGELNKQQKIKVLWET